MTDAWRVTDQVSSGRPGTPVVVVRGEAIVEVEPEIATISVTIGARDHERGRVLRRLTERVEALRSLLDGYGGAVERRETAGMYVQPQRRRSGERIAGYTASVTTTVTVGDFTVLGELMLRLADQEQTTVSGPWWRLRPDSHVYAAARRTAIDDALSRAHQYAAALGARVTGLLELGDAGDPAHAPWMQATRAFGGMAALAEDAAGGPALDLEPQRQTVQAQIYARFSITGPTALAPPGPDATP